MTHGRLATKYRFRRGSWDQLLALLGDELQSPMATALEQMDAVEQAVRGSGSLARAHTGLACDRRQLRALDQVMQEVLELHTYGRVVLKREPVDLGQTARRLAERLIAGAPALGRRLSTRVAAGVVGWWDLAVIEQIIETLLLNALAVDGEQVQLAVSAARGGGRLSLCNAAPVVSPLVRHLVEAHGGRIRTRSRRGARTTCEVCLPRAPRPHRPLGKSSAS
jgi:signal transduction histidine kinase